MKKVSDGIVGLYVLALKRNEKLVDVPAKWLRYAQARYQVTGVGHSFQMPQHIKMIMKYANRETNG